MMRKVAKTFFIFKKFQKHTSRKKGKTQWFTIPRMGISAKFCSYPFGPRGTILIRGCRRLNLTLQKSLYQCPLNHSTVKRHLVLLFIRHILWDGPSKLKSFMTFLKIMGHTQPLFHLFSTFHTNITIFRTNNCEKMSI